MLPVNGMRVAKDRDGDSEGGPHQGFDVYTGTPAKVANGDRSVFSMVEARVLRVRDARLPPGVTLPRTAAERAGPFWVDTVATIEYNGARLVAVPRYLHLDQVDDQVKPGALLRKGQRIGTFWATTYGGEEGHAHIELREHDWGTNGYGAVFDIRKLFTL